MDKRIPVIIRDKIATAAKNALYVCGNSDFVIEFDFDYEWFGLDVKTARFAYNGKHQDVVFEGNVCKVPVLSDTHSFQVGVYAGNLQTTTPAYVSAKKSILCGSGSPAAPSPDVYAQIMEKLNSMSGGNASPEEIEAAVEKYLSEHPIESGGIDEEQLENAVQEALAEAKKSGEFNGADGKDGKDGKDANVTSENITSALGYTPANQEDVAALNEEMANKQPAGKYVKTVNGAAPDEAGNVTIAGDGSGVAIDTTLSVPGAAADAKAAGDRFAELTAPPETTTGRIVQIEMDENSPIVIEAGAEVIHAGRNLFEVGKTVNDYVKSKHLLSVDSLSQTMRLRMAASSDAHALRGIKIPFSKGSSIRVFAECVGEDFNPVIPIMRVESADGTDVTSGVTGVYNSVLGSFLPENFWLTPLPTSFTFVCNSDVAAYCYIGVQLKSDQGISNGTEIDVRVMAEVGDFGDSWEAGFLRSYVPIGSLVEIQSVSGINSIYAKDQSEIVVLNSTSPIAQSVNGKSGVVVLNAKDVGAVDAHKHAERVYNTVADMINDADLTIGKSARTLGYYSAGDGGAAIYTVDDTDKGYGIACVNGYCNIMAEKRMSPKMFGAIANGDYTNTDDTPAFQACLDFCAGRYIVDVTDGSYVIAGVKLYHGKTYDITGSRKSRSPSNIIVKHGYEVGFVGSDELGADEATGLPIITLNLRHMQTNGYYMAGMGFPTFIKGVWLKNSRIDNVYASSFGCFVDAIMTSFSSVSNCDITVSECAFRNTYITKGFVDCAFYSNYFMGITKFADAALFKPVVFEAHDFYTIQFSSNFIGGMWAIVGCRGMEGSGDASFLGWTSRDNIYSVVVEFATIRDDSNRISAGDIKMFGDQIWNCSRHSLVDTGEGKSFFDDLEGNTRIEGDKATFFNFYGITVGTFRDIVIRFCDSLFPESMALKKVTINNPVYLFAPEGSDFSESEHAFDTKIPLLNFNGARDTDYKYTHIEPWDGRVVDTLPVIQDTDYRYVLEGQTCYYNNKLLTCRGDHWHDAMGNVVTA